MILSSTGKSTNKKQRLLNLLAVQQESMPLAVVVD